MRVYVMTDMECVAGVVTMLDYCVPGPDNKYNRPDAGSTTNTRASWLQPKSTPPSKACWGAALQASLSATHMVSAGSTWL